MAEAFTISSFIENPSMSTVLSHPHKLERSHQLQDCLRLEFKSSTQLARHFRATLLVDCSSLVKSLSASESFERPIGRSCSRDGSEWISLNISRRANVSLAHNQWTARLGREGSWVAINILCSDVIIFLACVLLRFTSLSSSSHLLILLRQM